MLEKTKTTFNVKHPNLLVNSHSAVSLFPEYLRTKHCHQGDEYLKALIQQKYLIIRLKRIYDPQSLLALHAELTKCNSSFIKLIIVDLPRERLQLRTSQFTNTGVDYFASFYVSVKRSTEKRSNSFSPV